MLNFTRTLAAERGAYQHPRVAICPGFFMTKMAAGLDPVAGRGERMAAHAPLNRLGDEEDLKGITLLYASDAGKAHHRPQWMAVDGGVSVVIGG